MEIQRENIIIWDWVVFYVSQLWISIHNATTSHDIPVKLGDVYKKMPLQLTLSKCVENQKTLLLEKFKLQQIIIINRGSCLKLWP